MKNSIFNHVINALVPSCKLQKNAYALNFLELVGNLPEDKKISMQRLDRPSDLLSITLIVTGDDTVIVWSCEQIPRYIWEITTFEFSLNDFL